MTFIHIHTCATSSSNAQPQLNAAASMLLASGFSLAGYDVRIVDRTLGPGGGSIISKANGASKAQYWIALVQLRLWGAGFEK